MSDEVKGASREDFVECEVCTKETGKQVMVHRRYVVKNSNWWNGEDAYTCPRGHVLPGYKEAA